MVCFLAFILWRQSEMCLMGGYGHLFWSKLEKKFNSSEIIIPSSNHSPWCNKATVNSELNTISGILMIEIFFKCGFFAALYSSPLGHTEYKPVKRLPASREFNVLYLCPSVVKLGLVHHWNSRLFEKWVATFTVYCFHYIITIYKNQIFALDILFDIACDVCLTILYTNDTIIV